MAGRNGEALQLRCCNLLLLYLMGRRKRVYYGHVVHSIDSASLERLRDGEVDRVIKEY